MVETANASIAGYDVGGAHLKIAIAENGRVVAVRQIACPLWAGLDRLDQALESAAGLTAPCARHAVTMTGELTEIFDSREAGVVAILNRLRARLSGSIRVFMGLKGFGDSDAAMRDPMSVASANFLATASLIAARRPQALLIDMGSTTTDIIACDRPQGLTDAERLQTGELVYTGYTRTPVASVARRAPLAGQWQALAGDAFATMADVRRVLGDLPDGIDMHPTADGRGRSLSESLARLARGFGRDAEMRHLGTYQIAARAIAEIQMSHITDGALQVLSRPGIEVTSVVTAGIGAPAAAKLALRLDLPSRDFGTLIDAPEDVRLWATRCAPAVAAALIAGAGTD